MVYHISKVFLSLMYMKHNHMVYGKFHIQHCLVLDQNANDNAYSTPLRYEVWNVDHKMVILWICLCYNTFSHICVKQQNCPEHDTVGMSILFPWIVFFFPYQTHHFCQCSFVIWCWNSLAKLASSFWLPVCIYIWESNLFDPGSWTVDINWYI